MRVVCNGPIVGTVERRRRREGGQRSKVIGMSSANTPKIPVSYFKTTFKNSQERFDWLLQRKKGFDWLLRRKGGREEKVLIGCCGGREAMGLLGRYWSSNTFNEIAFYHCLNEKAL